MPKFEGDHNKKIPGKIKRTVRVAWLRARAWHGEEVTIAVRTTHVKNDAKVELKIFDEDEGDVDAVGDLKITDSKLDHKYTIDWKEKTLPADKYKFVVKAIIDGKLTSESSPPLIVDLEPPFFSA